MSIELNGTTGITTPDVTSSGSLNIDASAPDNSVVVTSSGNVGVNTSAPTTKLDVNGPAGVTSFTGTTKLGVVTKGSTGVTDYSGIDFIGGNLTTPVARIASITTGGGSKLSFGTSNSYGSGITNTAVTIDSSGNLVVGATSYGIGITGFGIAALGGGYMTGNIGGTNELFIYNNLSTAGTAQIDFRTAGTAKGDISWTNTSTAYNTTSDYRLKNNITPMTGALAKVAALNPVTYKWNIDGSDCEGFIAHELAEVCPQAVTGAKDAVDADGNPKYQSIDASFLVATLTAAIQEQQAIIDEQKTALEALTARVSALEATNV